MTAIYLTQHPPTHTYTHPHRERERERERERAREREREREGETEVGPSSLSYIGLVILLLLGNWKESNLKIRSFGHFVYNF